MTLRIGRWRIMWGSPWVFKWGLNWPESTVVYPIFRYWIVGPIEVRHMWKMKKTTSAQGEED